MLYPNNLEDKLNLSSIKEILKSYCAGSVGKQWVDKARFSTDESLLRKMHDQTFEFVQIIRDGLNFPSQNYFDASDAIEIAKVQGAVLEKEALFDMLLSMRTITDVINFFDSSAPELYPELEKLCEKIDIDKNLLKKLDQTFDRSGQIVDHATPTLKTIRRKLISESSNLRVTVQRVLKTSIKSGYSDEEMQPTIRNGRMVIPVKAENKRMLGGLIHDESSSGQTSFVEPPEAFEINNKIKELQSEERRELHRILLELTNIVRVNYEQLRRAFHFLGIIDFVRAKATLAITFDAVKPHLVDAPLIEWKRAYHPMLWLSYRDKKEIKPVQITLNSNHRILLISGPNAGGKSVTLKTVGLIQYMFQCGLPVPTGDHSKFGVFKRLFVDIGDEQSLENELSTYSAHLQNMHFFLKHTHNKTLFLIDEFGTGTEPEYGGAVAEALLHKLYNKKAFGVITTHYGNLKEYANSHEGIDNGAMLFDVKSLSPTYDLEVGKPGSSFALEIASKIGIDKSVVEYATKKIGSGKVKYDRTLKELESELAQIRKTEQALSKKEKSLDRNISEYQELKEYLDEKKKYIVNEAKKEAKTIIDGANKKVENAIFEIKSHKASPQKIKEVKKKVESAKSKIDVKPLANPDEKKETFEYLQGELKVGDHVKLKGQNTRGELIALNGKNAVVQMGDLKLNVKANQLNIIAAPKEDQKTVSRSKGIDYVEKQATFTSELDVRGKRTQEALALVDTLVDNAHILGVGEVRIIHGLGDGILRAMIRQHLDRYNFVGAIRAEHPDFGGEGVSVVAIN